MSLETKKSFSANKFCVTLKYNFRTFLMELYFIYLIIEQKGLISI